MTEAETHKAEMVNLTQENYRLRQWLAEAQRERDEFRFRLYHFPNHKGCSHTTACSIWREDGQGHAEGFDGDSGPCNCGALANFYRKERDDALAEANAACEKPEPALLKELPECDQRIIRSMLKRKITTDSPTPYDRELDACEKRSCPLGHSSCELSSSYRPVDLDKAKPRKRGRK